MATNLNYHRYCSPKAGKITSSSSFPNRMNLFAKSVYGLIILFACFMQNKLSAQSFANLNKLKGHQSQVYYSPGAGEKAQRMALQIDRIMAFYDKHLQFRPSISLLILSPADWNQYTNFPVYGMPHYSDNQTLIVASENNDFWKSFIPPLEKIPNEFAQLIKTTYSDKNDQLTMESFFDLLAIHELGHAYHFNDSLVMQRKWMGELFSNIFLHTYVAENEPELLPALTTFPKMVIATTNKSALKYTTLEDLEAHYTEIGQKYPKNYGWYQCRWHMAAGTIYDEAGVTALKNLWFTLKTQQTILDDTALATMLSHKVHQTVADVPLKWTQE